MGARRCGRTACGLIVDFHCHLVPPRWRENRPVQPAMANVDAFLAKKVEDGIDVAVVGNAMVNIPGSPYDNLHLDQIREWNEFAAELAAESNGRIVALTGTNPFGGDEVLAELDRALRSGAFKGAVVNSSVHGELLDSPRASEFWALVDEQGAPVFVHPPWDPATASGIRDQRVLEYAGRASDVALSVASVVFAGILDRHPKLELVCAAGGGGLGWLAGRLDIAHDYGGGGPPAGGGPPGSGGPPAGGPPPMSRLSRPPSSSLRRIYVDSCVFSPAALLCNVQTFGVDRVLFGTDFPPVNVPAALTLELVDGLPIGGDEKERILGTNAAELLGVDGFGA